MADKYWLGTTSAVYSLAANWAATSGGAAGDGKPGAGDDVYFDGAGDNPCTLDEATAAVNSLSVHSAGDPGGIYSAKLDFAGFAVNVTGGGNMTFDGSGEVGCGASTITCAGNFDNKDQGTWTRGTSTVVLKGGAHTLTGATGKVLQNLIIFAGADYTVSGGTRTLGTLTVDGTFTVDAPVSVGTVAIGAAGLLDGSNAVTFITSGTVSSMAGTWSVTNTNANRTMTLAGGVTYGGVWTFKHDTTAVVVITFGAGETIFSGAVTINNDNASGTYTVANNTNDPSLTFRGNLTIVESLGSVTWTKGTGSITHSGTSDTTFTSAITGVMEPWVLDKGNNTAKLTLAGDVYTDSFTGTQGRFDLNGNTVYSDGNVDCDTSGGFQFHNGVDNDMDAGIIDLDGGILTLDGGAISGQLVIDNLDFNLADGVTGAANYCDVSDSECIYGTGGKIDATTADNSDNGGNTGWDFGVVGGLSIPIAMHHYKQLAGVN